MKQIIKRTAQAILATILMGSLILFLGAPSFFLSLALLGAAVLSGIGLNSLGTFSK
jgi:hypothetical protein